MDNNPEIKKIVIPKPDFQALGGLNVCTTRHPASLELFYNLINDQGDIQFPNHLRPIAYALADENIKYLLITISPGAGKSLLTSVCYPIWELGLNFEKTVLGVSSAEDQMSKFLQASMGIVEHNKIYRNIFPNSVPDKAAGWSPFRGMFIKRRVKGNPDPSYSISGLFCYDDKTEVLTKHGWVLLKDVSNTDQVATRQLNTKKFEWQTPTELHHYNYSGSMINVHANAIDLVVTPNHNLLVKTHGKEPNELLIEAQNVAKIGKYLRIPTDSIWSGNPITIKYFGDYKKRTKIKKERAETVFELYKRGDSYRKIGKKVGLTNSQIFKIINRITTYESSPRSGLDVEMSGDDYCAFMGMYLSEGSCDKSFIHITQFKTSAAWPIYKEKLEQIFGSVYYSNDVNGNFIIGRTAIIPFLRQFGKAQTKFIPDDIMDATPEQQRIFWYYYRLGDGTKQYKKTLNNHDGYESIATSSQKMADQLQELAQKMGRCANVYTLITKPHYFKEHLIKGGNLHYQVQLHTSKTRQFKLKSIDYTGNVYCVSVPNQTLYVRRNGKAAWCGNSQSITGKHAQIIIGDDIEDKKYSESEHMLNQLEEAFYKTLLGRRDPRGARIILVGRRWDINDLYHRLEISGDWVVMCLPSIRENAPNVDPNLYYDITIPANLPCVFNNFTPATETTIVQAYYGYEPNGFYWQEQPSKADEAKMARKNAPAIYQTVYQSKPELSEMAIFKDDDFAFYAAPEDLHLGASSDIVKRLLNRAALVVQSWDTAFTADSKNDASVCYTAALISCNQNHRMLPGETSPITDFHYDVYVLDEFIAKLEFADLTPQAEELFEKWNPDKILIEKAAVGIPLVQHLTKIAAPVEGIAVQNVSKRAKALNGAKAGSAQGWMRSWRVKFPKDATWFPDTKREFIKFTGAKGQRDDRVDALVQIINFTIDYGISAQEMPEGWRTDEEIDAQIRSWNNPQSSIDSFIDNIKTYYNPMIGLCQTCKHFSQNYCKYHKLNVSALHSCSNYDSKDEVSEWQTINLK